MNLGTWTFTIPLVNVGPIIIRELREQARRPMTYWLRPLAAAAAILAVALLNPKIVFRPDQGGEIFLLLYNIVLFMIWFCVPLLTADCLSREKREGTLGLLFLTPLKAWEIIAAKGVAHGLRAVAIVLAVVPTLAIPMLLGGVAWEHYLFAAIFLGISLGLTLSAGILASALTKARNRAMILAMLLAGFQLLAACWLMVFCIVVADSQSTGLLEIEFADFVRIGFLFFTNGDEVWTSMINGFSGRGMMPGFIAGLICPMVLTFLAMRLASFKLRRGWQENPPSKIRLWLADFFCTPTYAVGFYYRWLKRGLRKNPIGWLEKRRWSGRLATWIWISINAVFLIGAFSHPDIVGDRDGVEIIKFIFWVMAVNMALMAAGSFARERATGVMELLLISPLREGQIIFGRLRGIWAQFLPGVAVLVAARVIAGLILRHRYYQGGYYHGEASFSQISFLYFAVMLITAPVIGLYYSLRCRAYLTSAIMTLLVSMAGPWIVYSLGLAAMENMVDYLDPASFEVMRGHSLKSLFQLAFQSGLVPIVWQAFIGVWLLRLMHRRLVRRNFSYQSG